MVYVSHIDQDHISGVLDMLDTKMRWRVFEHQRKKGNKKPRAPDFAEPPKVGAIWHNAFFESITRSRKVDLNLPDIASVLSRTASIASGGTNHSALQRAAQARAKNTFKLWFNCGPASAPEAFGDFWNEVRTIVAEQALQSSHRLRFSFFSRTTHSRLIR